MSDEHPESTGPAAPRQGTVRGRKFSQILNEIAADPERERVSLADLLAAMGDRAFGALLLVFALPNAIPTPPGTSGILGVPLVFLAAQLMLGRKPWLPKLIAGRSMARADFASLIERAGPWLAKAERLLKPRLLFLVQPPAEYVLGAFCLVMALVLVLPIPLGNILPAFAICLFSFAILERDGAWAIAGAVMSAVSLLVAGGVIFALVKAAIFVIANAFA